MSVATFGSSLEVSIPVGGSIGRRLLVGPSESKSEYSSIQDAINDAREGDTIYVQPGTYTTALTVSKNYITIVGAQVGRYGWPDIAPTTGVALTVTGQGFVAKRLRFVSADSDVVVQRGNGAVYERCIFDSGTGLAATEGLLRLQGSAVAISGVAASRFTASECRFIDCLFRGASGVGVIFQPGEPPDNGVGSSDCEFINCWFTRSLDGPAGVDMSTQDSVAGGSTYSVKNLLVRGCYFADKNKATYIDFTTANGGAAADQTGSIQDCYFADDAQVANNEFKIVGTGFTLVGCWGTAGHIDGSGLD